MNKWFFLLSFAALVSGSKCEAQTLPEGLFFLAQLELGKTTIDEIREHYGPGKLYPIEAGDGPDQAICYSNGKTPSAPAVIFETGALGGWKRITAYRLTTRQKLRCASTSIPISELSSGNGLHRSLSRRLALQNLNKSFSPHSSDIDIEQVYQRKATPQEVSMNAESAQLVFDVVDIVRIRFKGDVVNDIYVKRLVSY